MAIRVNCECGKTLNVKDELEGKRIKCPNCKNALTVSANESGSGVSKVAKKQKAANGNGEKKGGGKMILAVLGAGVLVLGCCCFGGAGFGGWWFFLSGPSSSGLETKIVGKWVPDIEPPKKGSAKPEDLLKLAFGGDIEFKADKTVIDKTPMTPITMGKWKTVSTQGDVITVELSEGPITKKLDIKVVSNDSIKITPADSKMELAFKRAP